MPAGVDDSDDDRAFRLDEIVDRKIAFRNQGAAIVVEFDRVAPRIEGDLIGDFEVTLEKLVGASAGVSRKIIIRQLHVVADRLQRDHWPDVHLRRWIVFFNSAIVSVTTLPSW